MTTSHSTKIQDFQQLNMVTTFSYRHKIFFVYASAYDKFCLQIDGFMVSGFDNKNAAITHAMRVVDGVEQS